MKRRLHVRATAAWVFSALLVAGLAPASSAQTGQQTDEEFIDSLGRDGAGDVDHKRLARMFFSLAATLDGGKSSVQLLQSKVVVPEASRQAVRSLLRARYADYARSIERFKGSASELLDRPESILLFSKSMADGHRVCWHLDLHNRLIETYGADAGELMTILASREACNKFRTIAFQPSVEALLLDALADVVYQREEIRRLRQDVADLEELVADLMRIEASE